MGLSKIGIVDNPRLLAVWNKVDDEFFEGHSLCLLDYQ